MADETDHDSDMQPLIIRTVELPTGGLGLALFTTEGRMLCGQIAACLDQPDPTALGKLTVTFNVHPHVGVILAPSGDEVVLDHEADTVTGGAAEEPEPLPPPTRPCPKPEALRHPLDAYHSPDADEAAQRMSLWGIGTKG